MIILLIFLKFFGVISLFCFINDKGFKRKRKRNRKKFISFLIRFSVVVLVDSIGGYFIIDLRSKKNCLIM